MVHTTALPPPPQALAPARTAGIDVRGLRKSFGDQVVLDGLDLEVAPGEFFALLGPNGSGKTTTVQILSTPPGRPCRVRRCDGQGGQPPPGAAWSEAR